MNKTLQEAESFLRILLPKVANISKVEVVIAPPFTALAHLAQLIKNSRVRLAAQNLFYGNEGAFTGEISPVMLREIGCQYAIIGHSERRQLFHEDNSLIQKKLKAALRHNLIPILCVGETLQQRKAGSIELILTEQIAAALADLDSEQIKRLVIAYEPLWAIGTGETASPQDAEAAAVFIRQQIKRLFGDVAASSIRIQYGGSVKPENALELLMQTNIDGALVGGASLNPEIFTKIIEAAVRARDA